MRGGGQDAIYCDGGQGPPDVHGQRVGRLRSFRLLSLDAAKVEPTGNLHHRQTVGIQGRSTENKVGRDGERGLHGNRRQKGGGYQIGGAILRHHPASRFGVPPAERQVERGTPRNPSTERYFNGSCH